MTDRRDVDRGSERAQPNPYAVPNLPQSAKADSPVRLWERSRDGGKLTAWLVLPNFAAGLALGAVSRYCRDFVTGPIHYEAIGELAAKILVALLTVPLCFLFGFRRPIAVFQICTASLWAGALAGWTAVHKTFWMDAIVVNVAGAFITMATGSVLMWLLSRFFFSKSPPN